MLAHHWALAGAQSVAAHWHARAARWIGISNYTEAAVHWRRVFELLSGKEMDVDALRLRVEAVRSLFVMGYRTKSLGDDATAMFAAFVTTWAPSVLLSGFSNSIRSMPAAVQPITYALPARYFNKIVRDIYLRGASWPQILPEVLPMAAIGIGLVLTSVLVIRKRA